MRKNLLIFSIVLTVIISLTIVSCDLINPDPSNDGDLTNDPTTVYQPVYAIMQCPGNLYQITYIDIDDSSDPLYYQKTRFDYINYDSELSSDFGGVHTNYFSDRMLMQGGRSTVLYPDAYQYDRSNTDQRVLKISLFDLAPASIAAGYETSARWRFRADWRPVDPLVNQQWQMLGDANCTDDGFGWNWTCLFWDIPIDARVTGKAADMTIDFNNHTVDASVSDETLWHTAGVYVTVIGNMTGENEDIVLGTDTFPY